MMEKYRVLPKVFIAFSIILFGAMCAVVGYNYAYLKCGASHLGFSAPASTAFLLSIPFLAVIIVLLVLAKRFSGREK